MHAVFVIFIGWTVSFLGQLPLGTMSITSTQIAVEENFRSAWRYTFGVAIVEIIYLRLTLSGVDWIMQHPVFYKTLKKVGALHIKTINMAQGNKKSRILAWTFFNEKRQQVWRAQRNSNAC